MAGRKQQQSKEAAAARDDPSPVSAPCVLARLHILRVGSTHTQWSFLLSIPRTMPSQSVDQFRNHAPLAPAPHTTLSYLWRARLWAHETLTSRHKSWQCDPSWFDFSTGCNLPQVFPAPLIKEVFSLAWVFCPCANTLLVIGAWLVCGSSVLLYWSLTGGVPSCTVTVAL